MKRHSVISINRTSPEKIFFKTSVALVVTISALFYVTAHVAIHLAILAGINGSVMILMYYDKKISTCRKTRIPEIIFHLLELTGGTPASFIAQHLFKHKISKSRFQKIFWVIVAVQSFVITGIFF